MMLWVKDSLLHCNNVFLFVPHLWGYDSEPISVAIRYITK